MCDNNTEDSECRQRLRPWLEAQITGGQIPGLYWLNDERTKFRIPWKHRGKQDWDPSHGKIFMEWAKQTGRYREGVDKEDYVQWKTRLRCALHKAKDFKYLKDESQDQEDLPEPYRVYSISPRTAVKRKLSSHAAAVTAPSQAEFAQFFCQQRVKAPIPTMLASLNVSDEILPLPVPIPSDLRDLKSTELREFDGSEPMNISQISFSDIRFDIPETKLFTTVPSSSGDISMAMLANPLFGCEQLVDSMSSMTLDSYVIGGSSSASAAVGNDVQVTAFGATAATPFTQGYATASHMAGGGMTVPASDINWPQASTTRSDGTTSNLSPVDWNSIGKTDPDISQFLHDLMAKDESSPYGALPQHVDWLVPRNTNIAFPDNSSNTDPFYGDNVGEISVDLQPIGSIPFDPLGVDFAGSGSPSTLEGVVYSVADDGEIPTTLPPVGDTGNYYIELPNFDDMLKCDSFN